MQKVQITGEGIVNRIDLKLKERNLKRSFLAESVNFSLQGLTDWKRRGTIPAADVAYRISQALGVSLEWLLTGQDVSGLTDEQREILGKWAQLTDTEKAQIENMIDFDLSHFHAIQ